MTCKKAAEVGESYFRRFLYAYLMFLLSDKIFEFNSCI